MTTQDQAVAVLAVLNTAIAPSIAYDYDKVPQTRPDNYQEISISRRFGGMARNSAQKGRTGWRITVRSIGSKMSNARLMHDQAQAALEGLFLDVDGKQTPIEFETEEMVGPDDRWFSGMTSYTYTT